MRTGPLVLATAVMLALAGCVPSDSPATSAPSASPTPVFASDAEALAAAEAAYAAYLKVSDQILAGGGMHPEQLLEVASESVYATEAVGYASAKQKGWRSVGASKVDGAELQSYESNDPSHLVTAYLCIDVSGVDVVDSAGVSVVSSTRPDRTAFEISFGLKNNKRLIVLNKQVWPGGGIC
jgi:hypothetical protein